jgi:preprotein translocase subunit YajC
MGQDDKEWLIAGIIAFLLFVVFYFAKIRPYDLRVEKAKAAAQVEIAKCKGNYIYLDFGENQKVDCL